MYISGVKAILKSEGIELNIDLPELTALVRACKKNDTELFVRIPTQRSLISGTRSIRNHFVKCKSTIFSKIIQTITVSEYFGMLRIGEMMTGLHPVAASDVLASEANRKLQYILRSSKTHGKSNRSQIVTIISSSRTSAEHLLNKHCPYQIILSYANERPRYRLDSDPFFVFRDGMPVTPHHYRRRLNKALTDIGLEARYYGCHSLRIGCAIGLYKGSMPVPDIVINLIFCSV